MISVLDQLLVRHVLLQNIHLKKAPILLVVSIQCHQRICQVMHPPYFIQRRRRMLAVIVSHQAKTAQECECLLCPDRD